MIVTLIGGLMFSATLRAETFSLDASKKPEPAKTDAFKMGTGRSPDGHEIGINSVTLMRDGKPWLPVMGEFHYSRYPASQWRDELLKMKAGGIQIVATYVFWIHHEEVEGQWDWTGQRSLRDFVKTCGEVGLPVIVRMGPWCHGEVRNGGLPDWILPMGRALRSQDPAFTAKVKILYGQIAEQLKGLLWKDGGPVIGAQVDNEYRGPAAYLLNLKQIARDAGIDVPIYTRTGWPNLTTKMPLGEIVPLYGAYPEGFWDRVLTPMPGKYWFAFVFSKIRMDTAIGTDVLGDRDVSDDPEVANYPFLSCELGGGMMNSYHRRILIDPRDIESVALVKTGSGSNLPGYYMYHGGTNPQGKLTTLMEAQATKQTNYNDMPVKNYDFQAPLGQYGQVRPQYHGLRKLHMFLADWGSELAMMPATVPAGEQRKNDTEHLRFAVRSDGTSGFLFVNNYQRLLPMPARDAVQFDLKLADGNLKLPAEPFRLPADVYFVWPFNLPLDGAGAKLIYATAQPICRTDDAIIFGQSADIPTEFVFDAANVTIESTNGQSATAGGQLRITQLKPGTDAAIRLQTKSGKKLSIVLLSDEMSRQCWKGSIGGRERVLLSRGDLIFDGNDVRVRSETPQDLTLSVLDGGAFRPVRIEPVAVRPLAASVEKIKDAGPLRKITMGAQRVAEEPSDADFDQAAVYRVKLPATLDPAANPLLRVHYVGDVARAYAGDDFLTDDFYNGRTFDVGLTQNLSGGASRDLLIKILPLEKGAPIYLAKQAMPDFGTAPAIERIDKVELIQTYEARIGLR